VREGRGWEYGGEGREADGKGERIGHRESGGRARLGYLSTGP